MQKIYAHRGASGYAPENTLRAFALAADMGADGVELDVQISKDGRLVVFHDDELSRLTGFTGSVADYTYAELCRMPVIHAVDATEKDVAPLLEDVLALLHERGLSVNIELKNSRAAFPALEEKTIEAVEKAGMKEKTIYSSFNHYSLLKVRRLDPNAVCGLLYDAMLYQPWDYARQLGVQALHPHFSEPMFVTGEVEAAHRLGLSVNVWTPDGRDELRRHHFQLPGCGAARLTGNARLIGESRECDDGARTSGCRRHDAGQPGEAHFAVYTAAAHRADDAADLYAD